MTGQSKWQALSEHAAQFHLTLRELFQHDKQRFEKFSVTACGLLLDYSKNLVTETTLQLLLELIKDLPSAIAAMFAGEKINTTEQRAVLHTALRNPETHGLHVDGQDIRPEIQQTLAKMATICQQVETGEWLGYSGLPITDVVNIGIGGSDLGPQLVTHALAPYQGHLLNCHFVSNIDASQLHSVLKKLTPATTLFIVASKTFTTIETLTNATTAKNWLLQAGASEANLDRHFIAITAKPQRAYEFGISQEHCLPMWDWVGGRFSLWSAIGLPIALAIGMANFKELLQGAYAMDEHFRTAPMQENMPVILALLGFWYGQFFGAQSYAVLPYDHLLRDLPSYLQQLEMESNGKSVQISGAEVTYPTAPVVWGAAGTNGQHAFHQLLHQGQAFVPIDFIIACQAAHQDLLHQEILFANCLAQSNALAFGKTASEVEAELSQQGLSATQVQELTPHLVIPGNKPNNLIMLPKLTPKHLGALIALYEHKVFVQGKLWQINSFDQWGVELGKKLAQQLLPAIQFGKPTSELDSSTLGLLAFYEQTTHGQQPKTSK